MFKNRAVLKTAVIAILVTSGFSALGAASTCPTSGDVVISSSCSYTSGNYTLDSLKIESGVTVTVENDLSSCDTSFRGNGCSSVEYENYGVVIISEGETIINGTVKASENGFSDDSGPGAGDSASISGGGGYGGAGGDSDTYNDGGGSYGTASESDRPGSGGGEDADGIAGGYGGGSFWIKSYGDAEINGVIKSKGGYGGGGAGGGAGGSIKLQAADFTGSGTLNAEGGDNGNRGGGGGGGRIYLASPEGGANSYSISVSGGDRGNSGSDGNTGTTYTATWEPPTICDTRGQNNECILNEEQQLEPESYNISSIFISETSANINALKGQAVLDISNSSFISGLWHGSFYLNTSNPVLEPGASFKPEKGRIILGR
jgi:hypothetical protein